MPCCFNFRIGQAVACLYETNRHICAGAAEKFDKTLDLGWGNNQILITRADPNAHRCKVG